MTKTAVLEIKLADYEVSDFARQWIEYSGMSEELVWQTYFLLRSYRLSRDKIASQAHLLGRDPETIERNYQNHIGLLRHDYTNRNSGRDLLVMYAQLLGIPPETINANVQFLHSLGIDYNNGIILGTTPQLKRKKMAWMLRELFDYRNLSNEQKPEAIQKMYDLVRENPQYLIKSINALERSKEKLRERVAA